MLSADVREQTQQSLGARMGLGTALERESSDMLYRV